MIISLFDVDKEGATREDPSVNHSDGLPEGTRKAHSTMSTTFNSPGQPSVTTRIAFKNNLLVYYDDQNRVIKIDGFISSVANYPITIQAVYGYDVFTDVLGISRPTGL